MSLILSGPMKTASDASKNPRSQPISTTLRYSRVSQNVSHPSLSGLALASYKPPRMYTSLCGRIRVVTLSPGSDQETEGFRPNAAFWKPSSGLLNVNTSCVSNASWVPARIINRSGTIVCSQNNSCEKNRKSSQSTAVGHWEPIWPPKPTGATEVYGWASRTWKKNVPG